MTIEENTLWTEGRGLWYEYVRVNGYSWEPCRDGLKKLARLLDLTVAYISKRIWVYLNN